MSFNGQIPLPTIDAVVEDIERVLEETGIRPDDMTVTKYTGAGGKFDGRMLRRLGGFSTIVHNAFCGEFKNTNQIVGSRYLAKHKAYVNKLERQVSDNLIYSSEFLDKFDKLASRVLSDKIVIPKYNLSKTNHGQTRIINLLLSDLHLHALLDKRQVPLLYGPVEEARRLAAVAVQTVEYKKQYRDDSILFVHLLGDIIQNQLHDARDGATLAEQSCAAIYVLEQVIGFLASHFKQVVVRCTPGNHGRNTARHHDRAIHDKFDSIETIIYYGLKRALAHLPTVTVEIPRTPYFTYNAFDKRAFMTHGDTVLQPGFPGKSINIADIRRQINEINGKINVSAQYSLFAVGHVHIGSITHLPNGAVFMSNGALIPPDDFAISMGSFDTACGQWIWESVDGYMVGDHRFAVVDENIDKDKSLDSIIKPFKDF